jgi:hypothetical protein
MNFVANFYRIAKVLEQFTAFLKICLYAEPHPGFGNHRIQKPETSFSFNVSAEFYDWEAIKDKTHQPLRANKCANGKKT